MAAYASLVSLINSIDQINNHPQLSVCLDKKQAESLREKLDFLLDFVEADCYGVMSKEAQALQTQIASAAYPAQDAIESHILNQILPSPHHKTSRRSISSFCLWKFIKRNVKEEKGFQDMDHQIDPASISLLDLKTAIQDMDSIKNKVMQLNEERGGSLYTDSTPTTSSTPLTTDNNIMVGLDDKLILLLDKLTGQPSSRQIIPIVGMGGIGKTTLAKHAYQHSLIAQHFDLRTWVTVSQTYNVTQILLQLLSHKSSKTDGDEADDEQQLGDQLHKKLWGRRYLVVLDDIWSTDVWDMLTLFFPDNNNGSRIVVTTRQSNMTIQFDSLPLELSFLDEDKSWNLLCGKAFGQAAGCPPELEDIGKEIAKRCKGHPLSIVVIAGLLGRSVPTRKYWKKIAIDIMSALNSRDEFDTLSLSYTYLHAHLKPCFLYLGVFPEDHEIHASKLIKLWIAEGFIKSNNAQSLEEIARGYLKDLIDRNLILKQRSGWNGKTKTCKIHDLLRDLCLKVARKDRFIYMTEDIARGMVTHRIVVNQRIRGMVSITKDRWPFSGKYVFDQVNLRYLEYDAHKGYKCYIHAPELPSSMSLLWNLQTLVIRGFEGSIFAPSQIWEMRLLRHLNVDSLLVPDPPPSDQQGDFLVLRNLQTLKTVMNLTFSEDVLKGILNVRKLKTVLTVRKGIFDYRCLCKLESLAFESYALVHYDFRNKLKFPSSLKKLSFDGFFDFYEEDLTVIGLLPNLEVLKLRLVSFSGSEWNPVEGGFFRLKLLSLHCCGLVYWNANSSHFPVLETLVLREMNGLEEIPLDIGEIPTLEVIHVDGYSESVAVSAMKIAEEQESLGNENFRVLRA